MVISGRQSFFLKIIIGVILILVLLGTINIFQTRTMMNSLFYDLQQKRGVSIAHMLASRASSLILVHNYYDLHELMKDTVTSNEDVRYAFVVGNEGELLAHSFESGFPKELLIANRPNNLEKFHAVELSTEEGRIQDIAVPLFEGRLGVAHVGMSDASLNAILQTTTRQLIYETVAAVFIGIALSFFYAGKLTKPIRELVRVTTAITSGDFTQKVLINSSDEFGKLAKNFNSMTDYLYELLTELKNKEEARTHLLQKVIIAQEDERKRVARELHDETGQTLTSLMIGLKYLAENCPGSSERCQLEDMRLSVKRTLGEIHRLSIELRPSILDDMGLVAALEKYIDEYNENYQVDVDIHVTWDIDKRLAHEIEITVYRIIQEALTNIAKYAQAKNVSVIITCNERGLEAIVEDDGIGFIVEDLYKDNRAVDKLGLYGMHERASLVGGSLTIESTINIGTTVYLRIPIERS